MADMTTSPRSKAGAAFASAAIALLVLLAGCTGGAPHHPEGGDHSTPNVASAAEIIAMHEDGMGEAALVEWVKDPSRTFDLSESDVGDMVFAGVPDAVVNAAMARSDEHHAQRGHTHDHGHGHSHDH